MADRPHVRLMMAMTADGKIATVAREPAHFTGAEDRRRLEIEVARADALLLAAGTIRAYGTTFRVRDPDLATDRAGRGKPPQPVTVVVTRSLDLPADLPFFVRQDVPRIIATVAANERTARERYAGLAEVVIAGADVVDPVALLGELSRRGMRDVLALGGGAFNADLFAADLVDELHLTISPRIFGGAGAPTVVDGPGFSFDRAPRLVLEACVVVDGEVFLRYRARRE